MPQQSGEKARTSTLLRRLFKAADLKDFMNKNEAELRTSDFSAYISQICTERNDKKESVIKRALIERTYGHQLFNGTRKPSRDKVIQLAIGFGMSLDETQNLLQAAEKSLLYPRIKRDAAVIYCIDRRFDMTETQAMLYELGIKILGDE